jgi:hypothetical protein
LLAEINRVFKDTDSGLIHLRLRVLAGLVEYYRGRLVGSRKAARWCTRERP